MSAQAELHKTDVKRRRKSISSERPTCPVCADTMMAAEASAFVSEEIISHLWTCDTCGYGLVTRHAHKAPRLQED